MDPAAWRVPDVALFRFPKRRLRKLIHEGEYAEAIRLGAELEPRFGDDADFLFIMGSIYYVVEDAPKALHYFDRSLRAGGADDPETLHLEANIYAHLGDGDKAYDCCRRIIAVDPDHRAAQQMIETLEGGGGGGGGGGA